MNEYRQKLLKEIGINKSESLLEYDDWYDISDNGILSEDFMREFKEEIYWGNVYSEQALSDDFIIEIQDKMIWGAYFMLAKPSFTIAKKFITKTNLLHHDTYNLSHFNEQQINELQRIINLKCVFQTNKIKLEKAT